ncbi:MAG: ATP-binding protein [Acidobacteriota bacterium]
MARDVLRAEAPRSLKRLLDPLTELLGIPVTVWSEAHPPVWPDPGAEAHAILHREFPERGPCPLLADDAVLPLDGSQPAAACPLGMTLRRFPVPLRDGGAGFLTLGPYFTEAADREALFGRAKTADAALQLIPWVSPERQAVLTSFYREFSAFAGAAAKAGAAKEQFLANMSHELRTPLNGIMGMLSLLQQGEDDPRRRQFLDLAMNASNQLLGVINALLDMTSISAGQLVLVEEVFDLRAMLEALFALCGEEAASRGLGFATGVNDDVPQFLVGDAQRLRQVLLNLIHNALKFTERGTIGVTVAAAPGQTPETATLTFSVRDTGIGIPQERQQDIFDHFTIGEPFLSKRFAQAGLGLGISKSIVEKMGGSMHLESTLGLGSTFSFTAVLRLPAPHTQLPRPEAAAERKPVSGQDPGAVIVYAEDDAISQLLVKRILEDRGYLPLIADSYDQLIDILRTRPVDLVLMDVQMPGICGLESTRRIREGADAGVPRDIPIVGLSSAATPADRQRGLTAGMTDYIMKPVTRYELLAVVQRALAGRAARTA